MALPAAAKPLAPLAGALPPPCQRDLDGLREFVRGTTARGLPRAAVCPAAVRQVLLTGATGLLGRFVLRDLLRGNAGLLVHCLVRAADAERGLQRLRAALQEGEVWEEAFAERIRVVVGDVGEPAFGLRQACFDELGQRIDAVYHFAADVRLSASYLDIRRNDTVGIRNLLKLCLHARFKHLFFASSMGVFPEYFCDFGNEFADRSIGDHTQPDVVEMKRMFPLGMMGYPWSKLVAEQSLLFAQRAGVPVAVFRLPRTSASTTGYTQRDDISVRLLGSIFDVQMVPMGFSLQRNNPAADTLSRVCTGIGGNADRRYTIYHCCDRHQVRHDVELADLGLYLREVSWDTFKRACLARGERSPLHGYWSLLDRFASYWFSSRRNDDVLPVCDRAMREDCAFPVRWPGGLTMLRRSADWIWRRRDQWPYPVPRPELDYDGLIRRAERYAERIGVPFAQSYPRWIRDGLEHLVLALQAPEAGIIDSRRSVVVADLSHSLRSNAALVGERARHPEIDGEQIRQPVFIVGVNRTGTTYLHRLLSRDPRFWTLRGYELLKPVIPNGAYAVADTFADMRRAQLRDIFEAAGFVQSFAGIHPVDVDEPEEDFGILRQTFASWTNTNTYRVPGYRRWLSANRSERAYAYHRRVMQHFAWQRRDRQPEGRAQWLLKSPIHLMELESVIAAYPDALFIQTHREPEELMGSWASLVERLRARTSERGCRRALGAEQLEFMGEMLDRSVRFREGRHDMQQQRWCDVSYIDLVDDPLATVRRIYRYFDWPLDPGALAAMASWQRRQAEQRRQETRHCYDLREYGITKRAADGAFASYRTFIARHGIRTSRP